MAHGELPPLNITPGAIRFNTDSMKLEYFRIGMEGGSTSSYAGIGTLAAGEWVQLTTTSPEVQTGGTRALLVGGYNPGSDTYLDEIVYINVATTGNSLSFGELTVSDRNHVHSCTSDRTRGISAGGSKFPGAFTSDIEFVTIASTGNAIDFGGDLTLARYSAAVASNGTRGLFAGGQSPAATQTVNIDYITIQSTGVAAIDFGDLTSARRYIMASFSSSTRGIFAGGVGPGATDDIDFITMSTQGNAAHFGNLTTAGSSAHGSSITSNSIRGIIMGGTTPTATNTIDYLTIATLGDAQEFGELTATAGAHAGAAASSTRCVRMGQGHPAYNNTIEYVQIMTLGNSIDFGDLNTQPTGYSAGLSNGHGGL